MPRNRWQTAAVILSVAAAVAACNRKTVFAQYRHTPVSGWERNDTLDYLFAPAASIRAAGGGHTAEYEQTIGLRINGTYPFKSLYLVVEQTVLPSGVASTDTLVCRLVSDRGTFNGNGVGYYQYLFHLKNIRLAGNDSLRIHIRHDMKREILPGIADVGVRITRKQ